MKRTFQIRRNFIYLMRLRKMSRKFLRKLWSLQFKKNLKVKTAFSTSLSGVVCKVIRMLTVEHESESRRMSLLDKIFWINLRAIKFTFTN